jgi:superfamily II DNA or RNA helicase
MVDIYINNVHSKIVGHLPKSVHKTISDHLSYEVPGAKYAIKNSKKGKWGNQKQWDGIIRLYRTPTQSFYSGLLTPLCQILDEIEVDYKKVDNREKPPVNLPDLKFIPFDGYTPRDYQKATVERSVAKSRGLLKIATGGGKTLIMAEIISQIKRSPFMFYVLTTDLMEQAYETFSMVLNEPIGKIGGGEFDLKKINVCTIQTAIRAINYQNNSFKISDYLFDDEDKESWKKDDLDSLDKKEELNKLIYSAKGIGVDECLSGDTLILTEHGYVEIQKIKEKKCKYCLSYDGNKTVYKKIIKWMDQGVKKTFDFNFSNNSITCTENHLFFTQEGWKEAKTLKIGENILCQNAIAEKNCQKIQKANTFHNQCSTKWEPLISINENKKINVYDIEVEKTHCFFANNLLVHNCHHAASKTIIDVLSASPNAYWRYGCSATPYREDGAEMVIQGMFGKKIVDINASYLIKNGYLIKPHIIFEKIEHECPYKAYQSIYKYCISENEEFNRHVADTAKFLVENDLTVLILVQHYKQGELIKSHFGDVEFVTGKMSKKKRKQCIQDLRDKKSKCMIATTLADEGLDIPTLDVAILAGGGASATRVNQRIGRTLRKDLKAETPRDKAVVICYDHKVKYLHDHILKAKRIIKKEPEFEIFNSKGKNFIKDEIREIMNLNCDKQPSVFN